MRFLAPAKCVNYEPCSTLENFTFVEMEGEDHFLQSTYARSDVLNRTRDEAQLLASLQHQNILRVEAITEIDGQPAIVMEFVHGVDLGELIQGLHGRFELTKLVAHPRQPRRSARPDAAAGALRGARRPPPESGQPN